MRSAPIFTGDVERVRNLKDYAILDTPAELDFDDIAYLASEICGTPVSMISLVDADRQWFKSHVGTKLTQTTRDVAFCGYTINSTDLFIVNDATKDERFADNPLVTGPEEVRFYAGAPLMSPEGHALGALCVVDHRPRELTPSQQEAMRALARQVVNQMRLRRNVTRLGQSLIDQQRAEKLLAHSARHDGLTGLPNRALFLDRLEGCLARARRAPNHGFAVLFLDLDRFKLVNDSLGHAAGDIVLSVVAERLSKCLRDTDSVCRTADQDERECEPSVVARLGGDEFTMLLDDVSEPADAVRVVERILQALKTPIMIQAQEISINGSIGIVMSGSEYQSAAELLRDADVAMYRAKEEGRAGYMIFDATMQTAAVQRLRLENQLRHAVERDELELHYQPIVQLKNGRVCGFEALVRWRRDDGILVSPGDFIPIAEETGLIIAIGAWVLREACQQLARWQNSHPDSRDLWMSVNLSRRQLGDAGLTAVVRQTLEASGVKPETVKLEITETFVIENAAASEALTRLKALGVQISLDDFGTGYSSLSCLSQLPIDVLKIDRGFVQHSATTKNSIAVIEAIIDLAHALGMRVVAEGLETLDQVQQLLKLGCDKGQGFYFSKPLTADAAGQMLSNAMASAAA